MTLRAMSYGGGVQSTAMLVLAARGEIDFPLGIMSNVGNDTENPATIEYVNRYAMPYAVANGIELVVVQKIRRNGSPETLLQNLQRTGSTIGIPMRMDGNGAPGRRNCTLEFKVKVIAKELKRRGATADDPAVVALGISLDEYHRMRTESGIPHETFAYPLIDLRLSRQDCLNIVADAGLPEPPKSSCWFCPYHTRAQWKRMLRQTPELFAKSADLERMLNERRERLGKDPMWLTAALKPLGEAVVEDGQMDMFDDDEASCDVAGYCHI